MKKFFLRLGELICVALLVVFIVFVSTRDKVSTTPFEEVSKSVTASCNLEDLIERDGLDLKRQLSLEAGEYKGFVYYSSDSVMDVRELIVLSSDNKELLSQAKEKITVYIEEKAGLFEGYAPEESELINSHVLTEKKGFLLFYVGEGKEKVLSAFSEAL